MNIELVGFELLAEMFMRISGGPIGEEQGLIGVLPIGGGGAISGLEAIGLLRDTGGGTAGKKESDAVCIFSQTVVLLCKDHESAFYMEIG